MAHFSAWLRCLPVEVEEDIHIVVVVGVGKVDEGVVGRLLWPAEDIEHDSARDAWMEFKGGRNNIEDSIQLSPVL